jgi:hypothetical protein
LTLVLTEVSNVGIVMAADSAITRLSRGRIVEIDQQGWQKLLRVPSIHAGVSYWGIIGAVTRIQFDIWLQRVIDSENYTDLETFANHLANALNRACNNQPLSNGEEVGVHVAGYSQWSDGELRPVFYHVHNGHGRFIVREEKDEFGRLVAVNPEWSSDPRKLFEVHQDFPFSEKTLEENLSILQSGYITRNGAFFIYAVISQHIQRALKYINLIPNVTLPRDPSRINSRKGFIHTMLEMMIRFYRCSNQSQIIGGNVASLGIGPNGFAL